MAQDTKGGAPAQKKKKEVKKDSPKAVAAATDGCKFEECKKKSEKFGFCMEHYELYMAGVIRGDGKKPIDYAQKLSHHLSQRTKKVAA